MSRVDELARRRRALVRRCATEREAIGGLAQRISAPLIWVDRGLGVAPWIVGLGAVAMLATRPKKLLHWGGHVLDLALMLLRLRREARG